MADARWCQQESDALLEQMHETDRARARLRLKTGQTISDYERNLIPDDYRAHMRQHAADQATADRATRHREAVTAALRPQGIIFRNASLGSLNDHAIRLALDCQIDVFCAGVGGRAHGAQDNRSITVPPVCDERSYAILLHELGHVASPDGDSRQYRHVVIGSSLIAIGGETGAWTWAVSHATRWTRDMQDVLSQSLDSYRSHAATSEERDAITDCIAWARARVSGVGAVPRWRQREYKPGERVVHNGFAWVAKVYMHEYAEWPAPGSCAICWGKE
jgi:hypothetical protein